MVYASLYPFAGWHLPAGTDWFARVALPWPLWYPRFDIVSNLLGYLPLGALVAVALVRGGRPRAWAWMLGAALPGALSYGLEFTQQFLPVRVPSRLDWALNSAGAALGASLAIGAEALGWLDRWQAVRDRWLVRTSAGAIVLMLLWPVGLLFPAPVPFGLGHVGPELQDAIAAALDGTPWADRVDLVAAWSAWPPPAGRPGPLAETAIVALGVLAPCLVATAVSRAGWRRALLAIGAAVIGVVATTLSTALNFGPDHALAWWTERSGVGVLLGVLAGLVMVPVGRRFSAGVGLVALTSLVALVSQAPADPYYAQSLQGWEQGRFIRFHGLAQWVGWAWPYAVIGWLLLRLGRRDEG